MTASGYYHCQSDITNTIAYHYFSFSFIHHNREVTQLCSWFVSDFLLMGIH